MYFLMRLSDLHAVMQVIIAEIWGYFVYNTDYILLEQNYGYMWCVPRRNYLNGYNFEKYNLARNFKLSCQNDVESTM